MVVAPAVDIEWMVAPKAQGFGERHFKYRGDFVLAGVVVQIRGNNAHHRRHLKAGDAVHRRQDAVLVDLAAKVRPGVDVLFLETGYHFAETIGTRDAVAQIYDVNIVNAQAEQSVAEQDATEGPKLHDRDPGRCCYLRKVVPLRNTLSRYEAWVTGVRRVEAPTRINTPIVTWDDRNGIVKINPIAAWTDEDVDRYIADNGVLVNPLVPAGYPSIGCAPCTSKPAPGADPRSGR